MATYTTNYNLKKPAPEDFYDIADFNGNADIIDAAIAAGVKIATGSYVGTGTYGINNPNTITLPFVPKLLYISSEDESPYMFQWLSGDSYFGAFTSSAGRVRNKVTQTGASISWYCTEKDASKQFNSAPSTTSTGTVINTGVYRWFAIGV